MSKKFSKQVENRGELFEVYYSNGHWVIDSSSGSLSWDENSIYVDHVNRALVLRLIACGDRSRSRTRRRGDAHQLGTMEHDGHVFRLIQLDTGLLLQRRAHDVMGDVTWVDVIASPRDDGYDAKALRLLFST